VNMPYAEDMNYWKTSRASAGSWLDKASDFLINCGADVYVIAKAQDKGRAAYMIEFGFEPDRFRVLWPVLESKNGDIAAAERQAATMLYHDIKSRGVRIKLQGIRTAFVDSLLLQNGSTVAQSTNSALLDQTKMLPRPL